jgi:polysaccharide export outer membrane protein
LDDNEDVGRLRALIDPRFRAGCESTGRAKPLLARRAAVLLLTLLLSGCTDAKFLRRNNPQLPHPLADNLAPDIRYRVACPDVLDVSFDDRPDWDSYAVIDLDGLLPITDSCRPRVEGLTVDEVRNELARLAGVSPERVRVSLAAPRSGRIFISGPVRGRTRVVAYQGPERVIDLLKRVGGLPPGSKLNQVYVVRPHIAAGQPPEVFRVDVEAVMLDNNPATNIPLRPSDQVYIGETRGSALSRSLPHWMGTVYRRLMGLLPDHWWPFDRPLGGP